MTTYMIENVVSGVVLGTYEADSVDAALDACAIEAGYRDYADCKRRGSGDDSHLRVTEVE